MQIINQPISIELTAIQLVFHKNNMKYHFFIISAMVSFAYIANAFSSGSGLCTDDISGMAKGMGGKANSNLPISLIVQSKSYEPGKPIKIVVQTNGDSTVFKGLLLYAVGGDGKQIGQWTGITSDFKTLDQQCKTDKSTLSHANDKSKKSTTFQWTAPKNGAGGKVEFRGLVVGNGMTEWKQFTPVSVSSGVTSDKPPVASPSNNSTDGSADRDADRKNGASNDFGFIKCLLLWMIFRGVTRLL